MNALCLPPALEFNRAARAGGGDRFGARSRGDAVERVRSWLGSAASTGSATRASRRTSCPTSLPPPRSAAGNQANPRPASADEIEAMLRSISDPHAVNRGRRRGNTDTGSSPPLRSNRFDSRSTTEGVDGRSRERIKSGRSGRPLERRSLEDRRVGWLVFWWSPLSLGARRHRPDQGRGHGLGRDEERSSRSSTTPASTAAPARACSCSRGSATAASPAFDAAVVRVVHARSASSRTSPTSARRSTGRTARSRQRRPRRARPVRDSRRRGGQAKDKIEPVLDGVAAVEKAHPEFQVARVRPRERATTCSTRRSTRTSSAPSTRRFR